MRGKFIGGVFIAALGLMTAARGAGTQNGYDFGYRLSGDRRVAPIQVFDDARQTWLQFQPGQTLPAIFVVDAAAASGLRLAQYVQQGPYLVLNGTAPALVLRIGAISARADYAGSVPRVGIAEAAAAPSQWVSDVTVASVVAPSPAPASAAAGRPASQPSGATVVRASSAGRLAAPQAPALAPAAASALEFDVSPADRSMRVALGRWAREAGWTFQPEHWAVDVDIPLAGAAAFGVDFRHAVRALLAATELAETPLQPCFYSNRVLRVVPLSQACDRTAAPRVGMSVRS